MTAKGCAFLILGILALGVAVALALVIYRAGATMIEMLEMGGWLPRIMIAICSILIIVLGIGGWYMISSLRLRLCHKTATVDRARARVNDFTPTERGFAPRLLRDKIVNPNIVPSAITPLEAVERPEEIPEERRLAGVMGWHLSNAPGQARMPQRAGLPIPEPKPSTWEISHVERLLLEAGETRDGDAE